MSATTENPETTDLHPDLTRTPPPLGPTRRRRGLARVPGLGFLAPPAGEVDTPPSHDDDSAGEDEAGVVSPFTAPGAKLRESNRAARAGWYAPMMQGAPSTTRQAEILNTAIIAPPTGSEGIVNGRDTLSLTIIATDPITEYSKPSHQREVSSPNVVTAGSVGAGKSAHTKTVYLLRPMAMKNRNVVVFDKKEDDKYPDQGEYAEIARQFGVEPFLFTADGTGTRINLLDDLVAGGKGGRYALLTATAEMARNGVELDEWEGKALRSALRSTLAEFEGGRTPTPVDLMARLGRVDDPAFADLHPRALDRMHEAGLGLRWTFDELLTEYPGLLDGETSSALDLENRLTVFDVSQLSDSGHAVPVVMAIGHMWLMGRLRRAARTDTRPVTNVIYEEGWHVLDGPAAKLVRSNQKLCRPLGISNIFVMHKGTDVPTDSAGYSVIQEAQTIHLFRTDRKKDAEWAASTFNLEPESVDTLMKLEIGHCITKVANRPEVEVQHMRSAWERALTDTDSALAVAARHGE